MRAHDAIVRFGEVEFDRLQQTVFSRYPHKEWATFARFGWRRAGNTLVFTLVDLDGPRGGDLDDNVEHVAIQERYSLRIALESEGHQFAVGVIHSHPEEFIPSPSHIDDDMDGYYSEYFGGFTGDRPYLSLILSRMKGRLTISGRVFADGRWITASKFTCEHTPLDRWARNEATPPASSARRARLSSAFGDEATRRLRNSTVAVIGAGGTGSAAIEVLARAGVGRLILVDPDHLEESNLERVHGSTVADIGKPKVAIARAHVAVIDPACRVEAIVGALPQREVIDAIASADVAIGCTDRQHSRLALSDIAVRFLVPAIDCGVALEGRSGRVSGQIMQFVRFLSSDPCALCRDMTNPITLSQELMSEEERASRRAAALAARARGDDAGAYWKDEPQLDTVGYLTTTAGAMAAGYAIGWVTGRFDTPFSRLQLNLVAEWLDVTDSPQKPREDCSCRRTRGWNDQGVADCLVSAPSHWPDARTLS